MVIRRDDDADEQAATPQTHTDDARAVLPTVAGVFELQREDRTMTIPGALDDATLIHPGLWPAAATFVHWDGGETFHGGAFRPPGERGAWLVLSDRGGGKSTLLGALATAGIEVLADDMVVVRDGVCYAGPRCIDLRPEAVQALGLDLSKVESVRRSSRQRLRLPPCAGTLPLAGIVDLVWGEVPGAERVTIHDCFATISRHRRTVWLDAHLTRLAELAAVPMIRITRRRVWDSDRELVSTLLEHVKVHTTADGE